MTPILTARMVASAKSNGRAYALPDGRVAGLELRVTGAGSKSWSVRYRIGRRQRRLTLGSARVLSVADARELAKRALRDVASGLDPAAAKRAAREAATFGELAESYLDARALGPKAGPRDKDGDLIGDLWKLTAVTGKPQMRSWREERRYLANEAMPAWRHRPAASITRRDVISLVEGVVRRGSPVAANRLVGVLHRAFKWAAETERLTANPAAGIKRPGGKEQPRTKWLEDDEDVRAFWRATEHMTPAMRAFWRLRLLTAQRASEIANMTWAEVDLDGGLWTIPAGRSKNERAHRVPLSGPVLEILLDLRASARSDAVFVLDGARNKKQHGKAAAVFAAIIPDFRGHDLRRTAASRMAKAGVDRLHIASVLNHTSPGVTARTYDQYRYDPEKRAALDLWAANLDAILADRPATVVAFTKGRGE